MAANDPSDELLRQALQEEPIPAPSDQARQQALARALELFEAENKKSSQGSTGLFRPILVMKHFFNTMGDWTMHARTLGLAVTAALGVVLVVTQVPFYLPFQSAPPEEATPAPEMLRAAPPPPALKSAAPMVGGASSLNATLAPRAAAEGRTIVVSSMAGQSMDAMAPALSREEGRDRFAAVSDHPVKVAAQEPVSTFSADVDTASYSFVRRMLNQGALPPADAVRVEELLNYFSYDYPVPDDPTRPFVPTVSLHPAPWNKETRLLHIGIQGYRLPAGKRPRSHLTFLLDVSGSMDAPDKLPLLKQSLKLLLGTLEEKDTVAVVVYAGAAGVVLEPTPAKERGKILAALDKLQAGGSTAGGEGIQLAYATAQAGFAPDAVNRVILATDGDFNVGLSDPRALKSLVEEKRKSGIYLSVLGFGQGNYNDALMQELAQNGNGVAAYIDTLAEARKVLVEESTANLFPIAKDVKFQVEFNPARVAEYRLIGYETRQLAREDFKNDQVDAGEVGAGHAVTAIYEVTPKGSPATLVEPLRYGGGAASNQKTQPGEEWAFVKIRYKLPREEKSRELSRGVTDKDSASSLDKVSDDLRFAAAVAAFGERLRGGRHLGGYGFDAMIELARGAKGKDPDGYRAEFVGLVQMAKTLSATGR